TEEQYKEIVDRIRQTFGDNARITYRVRYGEEKLNRQGRKYVTYKFGPERTATVRNDSRSTGLHRAYVKVLTSPKTVDTRGAVGLLITVANREAVQDARETGQIGPSRRQHRSRQRPNTARGDGRRRAPGSIDLAFVKAIESSVAVTAGLA